MYLSFFCILVLFVDIFLQSLIARIFIDPFLNLTAYAREAKWDSWRKVYSDFCSMSNFTGGSIDIVAKSASDISR